MIGDPQGGEALQRHASVTSAISPARAGVDAAVHLDREAARRVVQSRR